MTSTGEDDKKVTASSSAEDHEAIIAAAWVSGGGSNNNALSETFIRNHRHLLYSGGLEDAFSAAASKAYNNTTGNNNIRRVLLVNIQNYDDDNSAFGSFALNRDAWGSYAVQDLIKAYCVFFQTTHNTRDAKYYMEHYSVENLPYVAILDPEKRKVLWKMDGGYNIVAVGTSDDGLLPSSSPAAADAASEENTFGRFTAKDFLEALSDSLSKFEGRKVIIDGGSSSRGSFTIPPPIDIPNEIGIQRAVMQRMASADCANAAEFHELQKALQESQMITDRAGVRRASLKRKASEELGIELAILERMSSADVFTENEHLDLQKALLESRKQARTSSN